jgi:hypothetical protein
MKTSLMLILVAGLLGVSTAASAACDNGASIAGTYKTTSRDGHLPNVLTISRSGDSWRMILVSHWAQRPNDDGSRTNVGNFEGELVIPEPWSCVAWFEHRSADSERSENEPICALVLTFHGSATVQVRGIGRCDYYHGYRAVPYGEYFKATDQ